MIIIYKVQCFIIFSGTNTIAGHLVTLNSVEENNFFIQNFGGISSLLGASKDNSMTKEKGKEWQLIDVM